MAANFFGLYRGVVTSSSDPTMQGRVQVRVPAVAGVGTTWAPVVQPIGGSATAMSAPVDLGSDVWVMFEGGDAARPVVLGKS